MKWFIDEVRSFGWRVAWHNVVWRTAFRLLGARHMHVCYKDDDPEECSLNTPDFRVTA